MAVWRKRMSEMLPEFAGDCRSPLSGWLGGKARLARQIVEMLPPHVSYCEPFAGAAWVLFRKQESRAEVLNDINRNIVTLYRVIQNHLEEFIRYFKWALVSRDEFERLKSVEPDTLTDIQRAARFYYIQQSCFGGRMDERPAFGYAAVRGPKLNLLRIEEHLSAAHLRLARTYIECLPYHEVIKRYDKATTVFYLDPPYWDCEKYYGRGIFRKEDFDVLAGMLGKIEGKFILSLNDRPEVREIFGAFKVEEVEANYSCSNSKNLKVRELIFRNFD